MALTVVVPTFDSADHICACLSSVSRCLPDAETIVVDNGSTDTTCEVVRRDFPTVVLLAGHGNVGFGRACNLGAERASYKYVLYLNPDAELVSVDLDALTETVRSRPFGVVAATLIDGDKAPRPTIRRRHTHWLGELLVPHLLRILSPYAPRLRYLEHAKGRGRFTVDGAVFLVALDEFRLLGGFDERFFMYSEDADLARRYRRGGYPLRAMSALLARHEGATSAPTPMLLALSFLGWLEYTYKWHGKLSATYAALVARVTYSAVLLILSALALVTRSGRILAKINQFEEMLSYIATEGFSDGSTEAQARYPAAGPIAAHVFRSFASEEGSLNAAL